MQCAITATSIGAQEPALDEWKGGGGGAEETEDDETKPAPAAITELTQRHHRRAARDADESKHRGNHRFGMCSIIAFFLCRGCIRFLSLSVCPQIFDFGLSTSVSFSNTPGSSPRCDRTNILDEDSTAGSLLRPTRDFIARYSASAGAYLNRSHSAATRFIECESWGSTVTLPLDL